MRGGEAQPVLAEGLLEAGLGMKSRVLAEGLLRPQLQLREQRSQYPPEEQPFAGVLGSVREMRGDVVSARPW